MPDLGQKCTRANFAGQDLGHRSARLGRCGESVFHMWRKKIEGRFQKTPVPEAIRTYDIIEEENGRLECSLYCEGDISISLITSY